MLPYRHRTLAPSTLFYLKDTHIHTHVILNRLCWTTPSRYQSIQGDQTFVYGGDFQRATQTNQKRLTLLFEGEVLCEMPALVVASKEEECLRVVDLQSPQVQYTLRRGNTLEEKVTHTVKSDLNNNSINRARAIRNRLFNQYDHGAVNAHLKAPEGTLHSNTFYGLMLAGDLLRSLLLSFHSLIELSCAGVGNPLTLRFSRNQVWWR